MTSISPTIMSNTGCHEFDRLADEITTDRLWQMDALSGHDRFIAVLAALASKQFTTEFIAQATAAHDRGMAKPKLREIAIHISMYAGLPAARQILAALDGAGLLARDDQVPRKTPDLPPVGSLRKTLGAKVKSQLHRERAMADYAAVGSSAVGLYGVATELLYGDLWCRPGLTIRERMICSIASFTALGLVSQQRKFFRSAGNVGLEKSEVVAVISQTAPYSGFAPALAAIAIADAVIVA